MVQRYKLSVDRPAGLDVGQRWADVVAIARRARAWRACIALGWESEDLEQEVCMRIHRKQNGRRGAYDPRRSGIAKYLHVATRSVLLHIIEATEAEFRGGRGGQSARELVGATVDVGLWQDDVLSDRMRSDPMKRRVCWRGSDECT